MAPYPLQSGSQAAFTSVQPFSLTSVGEVAPPAWEPWILSRFLARTRYQIVDHEGERVLEADANVSASGLLQPLTLTPSEYPYLHWRWKVPKLIPGADNASRTGDDSPVRVIVAFDGDKSKFDFEDSALAHTVKLFSGREMPYATIQYIWENKDFERLFGELPGPIIFVGVMTDSNATEAHTNAYYGDIRFSRE